jgi:uncharacterized membrane protein
MTHRLLLPAALLLAAAALAGCTTTGNPYAPVENVRYSAIGQEPFWVVTIGDDRIVVRTGREGDAHGRRYPDAVFARTLPRTQDGIRTWESGDGTAVISIEARPGPCTGSGSIVYEDHVRVRLSGRELNGCGGRLVERRRR